MQIFGTLFILLGFALAIFFFSGSQTEDMKAVAVFQGPAVEGHVEFRQHRRGTVVSTYLTKLPKGQHGFHIHKAGDLRGEGCKAACDHWTKGSATRHGGPPGSDGPRHTGDLGNIELPKDGSPLMQESLLTDVKVEELFGRSLIVHADPDDEGKGGHEDSLTTGHSGARIGCAIIGRVGGCDKKPKTATRKTKN